MRGIVEALHIYRGYISYEIYRNFFISFGYRYIHFTNENRIQGRNGKNSIFDMIMYFNY